MLTWNSIFIYWMSSINLLSILNQIADMAIGNEDVEDVGFNDRTTLPELLSYASIYPDDRKNLVATDAKLEELSSLVDKLKREIYVIMKKNHIKTRKKEINY